MKKLKKHQFTHTDPELTGAPEVVKPDASRAGKKEIRAENDNVPKFVYRDLTRTTYIISIFIALLLFLYLIQLKTNWLHPVLKIFGI